MDFAQVFTEPVYGPKTLKYYKLRIDLARTFTEPSYSDHLQKIQFRYWSGSGTAFKTLKLNFFNKK